MTKSETCEVLEEYRVGFPNRYYTNSTDFKTVIRVWQEIFADFKKSDVSNAVRKAILINDPSIRAILSFLPKRKRSNRETEYRERATQLYPSNVTLTGVFNNIPVTTADLEYMKRGDFNKLFLDNVSCYLYVDGIYGDLYTFKDIVDMSREPYNGDSSIIACCNAVKSRMKKQA